MALIDEFIQRTHSRGDAAMPRLNIGVKNATEIAASVNWDTMAEIARAAHTYLPAVLAEIGTLRAAHARNPERLAKRALFFGIATPNRDEAQSIGWALEVEPWVNTLAPMALASRSYRSLVTGKRAQLGLREALTATIAEVKRREMWSDLSVTSLESVFGVGPKVSRMIHAVMNPDAHVFAVDLWHMRQLLLASGREYCVKVGVRSPKAYATLESVWLDYAERFFPGVPIWCVQWSTWCVADGRFNSHQALWADLAA